MTAPVRIAVAFHSGYGHTARQAAAVATGVDEMPGAQADLHDVSRLSPELWSALADSDGSFLGAMPQSPSDAGPGYGPSDSDLQTAQHLGRRVARTALQLSQGRSAIPAVRLGA